MQQWQCGKCSEGADLSGNVKWYKKAVKFLQKACDLGDDESCLKLGSMYMEGIGVAQDDKRAAIIWEKSCYDRNNMGGCILSLFYYIDSSNGDIMEMDFSKAKNLASIMCDNDMGLGCAVLSDIYIYGYGSVDKDYKKAIILAKKACDIDDSGLYGCHTLGNIYHYGYEVEKNYKKAAKLYKKACDGGINDSCNNLGIAYKNGWGVEKNTQKAVVLYKKACDGGIGEACGNLGYLYENGEGVKQNSEKAGELYKKACELSKGDSCSRLGLLYYDTHWQLNFFKKLAIWGQIMLVEILGLYILMVLE